MADIFGEISIDDKAPKQKVSKKRRPPKHNRSDRKSSPGKIAARIRIWLFLLTVAVAAYSCVGFFVVPYYLNHSLSQQLKLTHNLNLSLAKITFNPFTFRLKTNNISITDSNEEPILDIATLDTEVSPLKVLRMEFVFPQFSLTSPTLHLVRASDNSYNISPFLTGLDPKQQNLQVMSFSELPFRFSINNITISDGTVLFVDKPADKIHKVEKIEVQLPSLSNIDYTAGSYISPYFSAEVNGSPLTFKESLQKDKKNNTMVWELHDFEVGTYVDYLPFSLPFVSTSGKGDGTISLHFSEQKSSHQFEVAYNLHITDFACKASEDIFDLSSKNVVATGAFNPAKKFLTIEKLQIHMPLINIRAKNFLQDLSNLLAKEDANESGLLPAGRKTGLDLQLLHIENGTLKSLPPAKRDIVDEWKDLSLVVKNYRLGDKKGDADYEKPLFNISGSSRDDSDVFTYAGIFTNPTSITGDITVDRVRNQRLFSSLLPGIDSASYSGVTSLAGTLSWGWDQATHDFTYSFDKVRSSTKNFHLTYNDKVVLTASTLMLEDSKVTKAGPQLDTAIIKGGGLHLEQGEKGSFYTQLLLSDSPFRKVEFEGYITITARDKESQLQLDTSRFSFRQQQDNTQPNENFTISSKIGDGTISGTGNVRFKPFSLSLNTEFTDIQTDTVKQVLQETNFIRNTKGLLSGQGSLLLPEFGFTGNLTLSNGNSALKGAHLTWKNCKVDNLNYTYQPYHLGIGLVHFIRPTTKVTVTKEKHPLPEQLFTKIQHNLAPPFAEKTHNKSIHISGVDIQELKFTDGQVEYRDMGITPAREGTLSNIYGSIRNIHSAQSADSSDFTFSGKIDGGTFSWSGRFAPFKDNQTYQYLLSIGSYPAVNFAKQLDETFDLKTAGATLSLDVQLDRTGDSSTLAINGDVNGLRPANILSDSALPLAMLTDVEGKTHISIDTSQPTAAPVETLFETLTKHFQTQIVKGNLSPLLLAKGNFTDLIDHGYIEFQPGLFLLSDDGRKTLSRFSALLLRHPYIKLSLAGGIFLPQDKEGLHAQLEKMEQGRVKKKNTRLYAKWLEKKQEFEKQLNRSQDDAIQQGTISESDIPVKVLSGFRPILPEPVVVDNEMLLELAEKRLSIVRNQIISQLSLDKDRVEITPQSINGLLGNKESRGVHVSISPREINE